MRVCTISKLFLSLFLWPVALNLLRDRLPEGTVVWKCDGNWWNLPRTFGVDKALEACREWDPLSRMPHPCFTCDTHHHVRTVPQRGAGRDQERKAHCGVFSHRGALALGCAGFSSCSTRARWLHLLGSRAGTQQLRRTGLVAPRHVENPESGIKPVSPALAGKVLTTGPPGKPCF